MKCSRFAKKKYILFFGAADVAFLNVEIIIRAVSEENKIFQVSIEKMEIEESEMEFAHFILSLSPIGVLEKIQTHLQELLTKDAQDNAYSLFYSGELFDDAT